MNYPYLYMLVGCILVASAPVFSQTTIWHENFSLPDGTTTDNGSTSWSISGGAAGSFEVDNNEMEGHNVQSLATWTSGTIDISDYTNVSISIDLSSDGLLEAHQDYIAAYYKLDGGSEVLLTNGSNWGDFGSATAIATGLTGSDVEIIVRVYNTTLNERYFFDDVLVEGTYSPPGSAAYGGNVGLKRIQRGSLTLNNSGSSVTIDEVDMCRSFLIFTVKADRDKAKDYLVRGQLSDNDEISFSRHTGSGSVTIEWQVFEFSKGVRVQHGSASVSGTDNVTIDQVDVSKSFVLLSVQANNNDYQEEAAVTGLITSSTNLRLQNEGGTSQVYWQVIEYQDANVQVVTFEMDDEEENEYVGITSVDTGKTLLITHHRQDDEVVPEDLPFIDLFDASTISFSRGHDDASADINYVIYVVEFLDSTTVQRHSGTISSSEETKDFSISTVNTDAAGVLSTGTSGWMGFAATSSNNVENHWFTLSLKNANEITVRRGDDIISASLNYQVIQFPLFSDISQTVTINQVQSGSATINFGSNSTTVNISPVTTSKSILLFSSTTSDTEPQDFHVGGSFSGNSSITFTRHSTGSSVDIKWQVIEYAQGVNVQHGTETGVTKRDVTISQVDLKKTFVIATGYNSGTTLGSDDGFTADLTNSTNLELEVNSGSFNTIYYQVVEHDNAFVQKVQSNLSNGNSNWSIDICKCDRDKSFLVGNHQIDRDVNANSLPRAQLISNTTVQLARNNSNGQLNYLGYVVEFLDGTEVIHGSTSFSSGNNLRNQTIPSTDIDRSIIIPPGNLGRQGSTAFGSNGNLGYNWFNYELADATTLRISRAATGSSGEAPYQIIIYPPGAVLLPITVQEFTAKLHTTESVKLNWTVAADELGETFIIERSNDGFNFTPIHREEVTLRGVQQASIIDWEPHNGINYYRLTEIRSNGDKKTLRNTQVELKLAPEVLSVYPNPVTDGSFTIHGLSGEESALVNIVSAYGQVIYSGEISATNFKIQLPEDISSGHYMIMIKYPDSDSQSQPLIVR